MIKIDQIKVLAGTDKAVLKEKIAKQLHKKPEQIGKVMILRHSYDARKKDVYDVYQVAVEVEGQQKLLQECKRRKNSHITEYKPVVYDFFQRRNTLPTDRMSHRPVIVGAGPCGYFCGLLLAEHGYRPIIIERGKAVEERTEDVNRFWETGKLLASSNVQFGEGGAGAFSDGKLNTLVKDSNGRNRAVLERFVKYGADESILYEQKPHVGTDYLFRVLIAMRQDFIRLGGEIRFETCLTDIHSEDGKITGITLNGNEELATDILVLAIGHSARDTFRMLYDRNISMSAKAFAVGFRVEHPQERVNNLQYGEEFGKKLPAAPYKVTANTKSGRGAYSFCMCPGGYVVNASSEEKRLAVNGMSYFKRDGKNANSAMIVSVGPEDYPDDSPLGGVKFQQQIEERAYEAANGSIPQQLFGDFEKNQVSESYGVFESETKGKTAFANLRQILPEELNQAFIEGMHMVGNRVKGFDRPDAILSGVESRTSSPVRIWRDEGFVSNLKGLYPCGEGAGYAGGIMSAAMDGMKIAEQIAAVFLPFEQIELS
ncbi:MAG: FAD-dependent oxidoreductase [Lachnospiraceae bacterium]|nr:FAD-dependent oxidoreductase [Lachnospiraceae bacterium]